jgi:hypothetical protein
VQGLGSDPAHNRLLKGSGFRVQSVECRVWDPIPLKFGCKRPWALRFRVSNGEVLYGPSCTEHSPRDENEIQVLVPFHQILIFFSTGYGPGMGKRAHTVSLSKALTSFLPPIKLSLKDSIALMMSFILPGCQGLRV